MPVKTKSFAVVQWPVRDLERSVAWYRDILGLSFSFEFRPGDNEAWLNVGGVGLGLIRCDDVPELMFTDKNGTAQPILQFQVENIHDVYKELQAKGVVASEMTFKKEGGYRFTITDPDEHIVSLWGGWPTEEDVEANQSSTNSPFVLDGLRDSHHLEERTCEPNGSCGQKEGNFYSAAFRGVQVFLSFFCIAAEFKKRRVEE